MNDMRKTKAQPDRQLLAGLVDQMLEPTVMLDFEGSLLHGNALAAAVLGLDDPAAIAGMSLAAIMHPDDLQQAAIDLEQVKQSEADFSSSYRLLVDGRTLVIESHGTKIELADGAVDLVSFRDITERREREERERANELILKSVLDNSSTVIFIKDAEGKYLLINRRYEELFGITNEEIVGKTDFDVFPAEAAEQFRAKDRQALEADGPIEEEELVPQDDGDHIYLSVKFALKNADGEPFATCGISTDITERKRTADSLEQAHEQLEQRVTERTAELEESEKMFRALTESMQAMVLITDAAAERIVYANEATVNGTGYTLEELTASPPPKIMSDEALERILELREAYFRGEDVPQTVETEILTKAGERRMFESSWALIDLGDTGLFKVTTSFDITDRKQAEEALKESEKKFRALANSTTASIAIVGCNFEKFLYANQTALDRHGLTWEQLSEITPHDSLTQAAHDAGEAALERAMEAGESQWRFEYQEDDGSWSEVNVVLTELDGEQAAIYTAFDITAHKQAQQGLEESERKFRGLAETTNAQITIMQDDRYVYANQAFLDYYELDAEDIAKINPDDLMLGMLASETIQEAMVAYQAAMERGDKHFTLEYPDTDGGWFHTSVTEMELGGKPAFMAMTIDISELKQAQQALAENEERYRTIFDTAGTGMISFGEDKLITMANEEWIELSGYSKDETIGKLTWVPFFTEQSLARMKKYHELRSQDPSSVPAAYEAQFVDRAGAIHDGIVNIQVIPGTQQRVASFQDMTELKRAQKEMYRADKMAALGQIIAGVAHEINNPNNFIYFNLPILRRYVEAMSPLLEAHLEDDPDLELLNMPYREFLADVYKLLENMEHGSKRITGIVSELKNYIRSDEEQHMQVEQLPAVIERVMALVGKQVRKMVKRFEVEVADDLATVRMNPGKIEQVLINLVINAGQAADKDDSWVELSARPADDPGYVEILVEDNGAGIPEENLDQVFEPFFTSKSREAGTGLGLSISHRIIEEHDGTIDVKSTVGEGTRFSIRLPVASDE